MHTLEKEPIQKSPETQRSFDLLASVNMMRYDLDEFGYIRPETQQRVYDEELTYIAEGIDRFSHTSFTLQEQDGRLVFFDKGEWRPYVGTLMTGLSVAKSEAEKDSRREFLVDWAARDLEVGYKLETLRPGEIISWDSPFPEEQSQKLGDQFLASVGLQPKRKMGFIYRAERNEDGSVTLETHSVDNSDDDAFKATREAHKRNPRAEIEELVSIYDASKSTKDGEDYFAGRKLSEKGSKENAWDFLEKNKPLSEYYMNEIAELAKSSLYGHKLYETKKALTIGVWARAKELLNEQTHGTFTYEYGIRPRVNEYSCIATQVQNALHSAIARQDVMIGCGGGISAKSLLDMSPGEAFDTIFGKEVTGPSDQYGPLKFTCPKGHENTRPKGELIECCQKCGISVRC
jgi:hypothetical protein